MTKIHPNAVVEPGAQLGEDVEIGPFCFVAGTAKIGDGSRLFPNSTVMEHTTLGARNRVYPSAVLGGPPQDLSFAGAPSYVTTGNDCTFREGVTIHRGTTPESVTRIGNHVYMMANSHAAHNVQMEDHVILANGALLGGYVTVGERTFFGGGAAAHQYVHIGRMAMIGGLSAVTKDLPPFCIIISASLNGLYGLNAVGMRRAGLSPAERKEIKELFHLLYFAGLNVSQVVEAIETRPVITSLAREWLDFLKNAKRGICRHLSSEKINSEDE